MKLIILALVAACLLVPAAPAAAVTITCNPVDVASFDNRVHVKCSPGAGAIVFFAVSTANAPKAERFLNLATTALINNKQLIIFFDTNDLSGGAFGCAIDNCRNAQGILMKK